MTMPTRPRPAEPVSQDQSLTVAAADQAVLDACAAANLTWLDRLPLHLLPWDFPNAPLSLKATLSLVAIDDDHAAMDCITAACPEYASFARKSRHDLCDAMWQARRDASCCGDRSRNAAMLDAMRAALRRSALTPHRIGRDPAVMSQARWIRTMQGYVRARVELHDGDSGDTWSDPTIWDGIATTSYAKAYARSEALAPASASTARFRADALTRCLPPAAPPSPVTAWATRVMTNDVPEPGMTWAQQVVIGGTCLLYTSDAADDM
jgi:hypothetical protein